jgi:hypothetical protein
VIEKNKEETMSVFRVLLRFAVLVTVAVLLSTCAHQGVAPAAPGNPCLIGGGSDNRNAPIVCVDDTGSTLSVAPDPVTAFDRDAGGQPVMIHWWLKSGGNDLDIDVKPGCVTDKHCENGHCFARTLPKSVKGDVTCKYDVWTTRQPRLDPAIVLTDCC